MRLPVDRALLVLHLLTEGCSVRSIERITGTEKRTILRLLVQVGEGCERLLPELFKGATVKDVQADEIWGYVPLPLLIAPSQAQGVASRMANPAA